MVDQFSWEPPGWWVDRFFTRPLTQAPLREVTERLSSFREKNGRSITLGNSWPGLITKHRRSQPLYVVNNVTLSKEGNILLRYKAAVQASLTICSIWNNFEQEFSREKKTETNELWAASWRWRSKLSTAWRWESRRFVPRYLEIRIRKKHVWSSRKVLWAKNRLRLRRGRGCECLL